MTTNATAAALRGLMPNKDVDDINALFIREADWKNGAAIAGTTAQAKIPIYRAKRPGRVVSLHLVPGAAVTANGTNYWTLLLYKHPASAPGTPVTLATFAVDTATTDDLVAFDEKDLTSLLSTTAGALDLAEGDVLTVEVTKTGGSGLAFPIAHVVAQVREESD